MTTELTLLMHVIDCWKEAPFGYSAPCSIFPTAENSWLATYLESSKASLAAGLAKRRQLISGRVRRNFSDAKAFLFHLGCRRKQLEQEYNRPR